MSIEHTEHISHIRELAVLAGMLAERCDDLALQTEEADGVRSTLGLEPDASTWTVNARLEYLTQTCDEHAYLVDSLSVLFNVLPRGDEEGRDFNVRLLEIIKSLVRNLKKAEKKAPKAPKAGPKPGR